MQDEVFRIASHIPHPLVVAGCSFLAAVIILALLIRARKPVLAAVLAVVVIGLGLTPFIASTVLRSRGVYCVRVVLVRPDQSVADIAQVKSSTSRELKMVAGGWELDIPRETRPTDGKVMLSASIKDEFLAGKSTLALADDYYPTATIQLAAVTSSMLRGVVVDEGLRAIAGAKVSIDGNPDVAVTDSKGNFVLPAHAGNGQMVEVRATKGAMVGHLSAPAGKVVEVILSSE
jgi:hypothetical protein